MAAAIPSGVGFLGAGMIWKQSQAEGADGGTSQTVHGLTTAATLWLSAAVGIAGGNTKNAHQKLRAQVFPKES